MMAVHGARHAGLNIFAHSDKLAAFWASLSNGFDAFIVVVSVTALSVVASGVTWPPVKMLRLVRVCRVLRLFRKLKNLNRIITAVSFAVFPVCNRSSLPRALTLTAGCGGGGGGGMYGTVGARQLRLRGLTAL
jgi:hypothetical protein